MKLHEFAKKHGYKVNEILVLLQNAGYADYTGIMSILKHPEEELINSINKILLENKEPEVNLVGMFYNPETRQYHAAAVKLPISEFNKARGILKKPRGTVYLAKPDFNGLLEENMILYPNKGKK